MAASLPTYLFDVAPALSCTLRYLLFFDLTLSEESHHPSPQPYDLRVQTLPEHLPASTHPAHRATQKVLKARINERNKQAIYRY